MGEGDGTVSLLSLGAMCVEGWKRNRWNPGGIKVTTVEVLLQSNIRTLDLTVFSSSCPISLSRLSPVVEVTQRITSTSSARRR